MSRRARGAESRCKSTFALEFCTGFALGFALGKKVLHWEFFEREAQILNFMHTCAHESNILERRGVLHWGILQGEACLLILCLQASTIRSSKHSWQWAVFYYAHIYIYIYIYICGYCNLIVMRVCQITEQIRTALLGASISGEQFFLSKRHLRRCKQDRNM